MEGIIIWVIIIIGWAVISSLSKPTEQEQLEKQRELFDKIRLQLQVKDEIPPKDRGLPQVKCVSVKVKGLFGHPTESKTKFGCEYLFIKFLQFLFK